MVSLTFYYKEGCWICDMVEEMVNGLKEKYNIKVTKININSDEDLYELYRFDIPVLGFKDGSILYSHIRKKDLIKKLKENKE